ncbi:MAG: hypothetical protein AW09_002649 [Candidatus Accumulibacter phosphatis]|uniref:Uncharacterized protein n=1 Tax=Candidatus Accumulibacter phosphatis TaxID=327160 RepID=A0A080LWJ2_9PROT|nr:MAG: hypothetical protein AW09_002649 [Candidatus Accumulibacter phosphatis]
MQVIGVEQGDFGLPIRQFCRQIDRQSGGVVIGMRVELRVRRDDNFRAKVFEQSNQITEQVLPRRLAIGIGWQWQRIVAARAADVGLARCAGSKGFRGIFEHRR